MAQRRARGRKAAVIAATVVSLWLLAMLMYLLGPHERWTEFNTTTWQMRSRESLWGMLIDEEPYAGAVFMWHASFSSPTPWETGPQAYYAPDAQGADKWIVIERSNFGLWHLHPDIKSADPDSSASWDYRLMADSLVEMCAAGTYGPGNPSIGILSAEARRAVAINCRAILERSAEPAEVSRYLVYIYEHALWLDPVSKRWRSKFGAEVGAGDIPSVQDFDTRDVKQYSPDDYLAWMSEG